jgi:hypothetical protein
MFRVVATGNVEKCQVRNEQRSRAPDPYNKGGVRYNGRGEENVVSLLGIVYSFALRRRRNN